MQLSPIQEISSTDIMVNSRQDWTLEEITYLKNNVGTLSVSEMAKTLGRPYRSTYYQLEKNGISPGRRGLTDADQTFLLTHWGTLSIQELAAALNVSKTAIYRRAKTLGLQVNHPTRFWTEEEEAYLIANWKTKSLPELQKHFNRTESCIRKKAHSFGLRKLNTSSRRTWSNEDLIYLKNHWGKDDVFDIAKRLDRSPGSIRKKAGVMKLKRLRRAKDLKPWTPEEEAFLIEHWHSHSIGYLTRNLKKSTHGVYSKAHRLKLGPKFDDGYTASEVSRMLGYSCGSSAVRWIEKGWLKAKRSKILKNGNYCISENQIKTFMRLHPELWSFETLTFDPFYDSNAPWVHEKRKADRQKFLNSLDD